MKKRLAFILPNVRLSSLLSFFLFASAPQREGGLGQMFDVDPGPRTTDTFVLHYGMIISPQLYYEAVLLSSEKNLVFLSNEG